jgi:[amino group carrier protein]-lysine/ornithine hydrolase
VRCKVPRTHTATPGLKSSEMLIRALDRLFDTFSTHGNANFADIGMVVENGRFEPFSSACSLSFRTPPGVTADELRQRVSTILGEYIEVATAYEVPAVVVPRSSACVRALSRAILLEGFKPIHNLKTGTSDMNTLSRSWDMPMATYGPGDPHQDHTETEYILIEEYLAGVRILRSALHELDKSLPEVTS